MLRNNPVILINLFIGLLWIFLGCLEGPAEKDPLSSLAGSYTATETNMECTSESQYWELTILPPNLTSTLNIQSDKSFSWNVAIIEDQEGIISDCLGMGSFSIAITGTVSGDETMLIFDSGELGIENYSWTMINNVLTISSLDGEDTFKFNKQ